MEERFVKLAQLLDNLRFRTETTKFLIDKPQFDYQPLPWVGITNASVRGKATVGRWRVIKKNIPKSVKSLKDIGCCVGYFCISASNELGLVSFGIDNNSKYLRLGRYATPKKVKDKCNFIHLSIDPDTIAVVPQTDVTLCLSIWHHWVYDYGLKKATEILKTLWNKTNVVMIFESGEEEIAQEFKMPFSRVNKPVKMWLKDYLEQNLDHCTVKIIGAFEAGDYPHYKIKGHKRSLFKITRKR